MSDIDPMPRLIKTALKVFQYANETRPMGWPRDVYYDRVSNVYVIENFPEKDHSFEVGMPMELGFGELEVNDKKYQVRIYET